MNDQGFQLHIRARVDGDEQVFVWDNVCRETADRILARWGWPRWALVGSLELIDVRGETLVRLPWKDIISIRAQPQMEAI